MGVYTKTGDAGQTGLYTGERVDKASLRVETYGTVDEVNSALAMARAICSNPDVRGRILDLQKEIPMLMADLASIGKEPYITMENVKELEQGIDAIEALLPPLKSFIVPGSTQGGAMLDFARTVSRRAERQLLRMAQEEKVHEADRIYLNRLSDYCFTLMRLEEKDV